MSETEQRIAELEAEVAALKARFAAFTDPMKCKTLDCYLCHGTPANAGPR
jgi:hypothetical protein